uniref:Uncharacterized protein n=1 Tax=Knipowitschia caucasica TaxID=637954 RepID=A0AAV2JC70_KNICA
MDGSAVRGDSSDAIVMEHIPPGEGARAAAQSDPPTIALCLPEEHSEEVLLSEGGLCDSCSSLGRPSSSCKLYHQVPQSRLGPFDSPSPRLCPRSSQAPGTCHSCPRRGKHGCSLEAVRLKEGQSFSSAQSLCSGAVRCHWLHSSADSALHKPTQAPTVRDGGLSWIIKIYGQLLVEHPLGLLLGCALLLLACSGAAFLVGPLPDFSNPLMGFQPRGTYISLRESSLQQLLENTGPGRTLSLLPQALSARAGGSVSQNSSRARTRRMLARHFTPDPFLCDAPGEHLAQLVFRSENAASLWNLRTIQSMCEMEQSRIRSQAHFQDVCQRPLRSGPQDEGLSSNCCPSWSLGNYLSVLTNASSCLSLTAQQVSESLSLLRKCAPYYHEGRLTKTCVDRPKHGTCASVPSRCKQSNVVFQILHFLVDKDFLVLAAGGTYMACVEPGMKLPTLESKVTQLFPSSHPFERYDAEYRHMFMFERQRNGEDMPLTLQLVWGVKASDNGDYFNPHSNNSLVLDPEFNMSSPESQCLSLLLAERYIEGHLAHAGGVYFHTDGRIAALVLAFRTTYLYSFNYTTTSVYYRQILSWFTKEKSDAPQGLARGWFVSQLSLLDLQQSLGSETLLVSGFSVALTFASLLTESHLTVNSSTTGNGAFDKNRVRRSQYKDEGSYLYPNHHNQQRQKLDVGTSQGHEQYELQPLAYRLSDSFENSTCTSKLSTRPSVLSDEIQFCSREDVCTQHHKMCTTSVAMQTSSPYKESSKQLCTACRGQRCSGLKHQSNTAFSSSSSIEDSHILNPTLCKDKAKTHEALWAMSQSSEEGMGDSNNTSLSIVEAKASTSQQIMKEDQQLQPGHLNDKRDTLRLPLKETTYESGNRSSSEVVIIPNSKPDLPDVWIKRRGEQEDSC